MKPLYHFLLIMCVIFIGGCSAIAGILKAGVLTGTLIVVVVVGVTTWLITKSGTK